MKRIVLVAAVFCALVMVVGASAFAAEPGTPGKEGKEGKAEAKTASQEAAPTIEDTQINLRVPLFSPLFLQFPVATVNDEPILLQELIETIGTAHEQAKEEKSAGKKDFAKVLNRLITIKLVALEATNMGIDELPEVKKLVDEYAENHLREMLKLRQVKDVKPDEKVVEKLYKDAVKEWKIRSVKFDKEEPAKEFVKQIGAGGKFADLADKLIESGKAEGAKEGEYLKPDSLLPQIANVISVMKVGSVSPVTPIGPAFTVMLLEDIRYPAGNAEARAAAQNQALGLKQRDVISKYNDALTKKYVKINQKLLKKLDFEAAKPGFAKLLKDKRVVAEMKGEKPVTVADLAEDISKKFFHGIDQAIKENKVNVLIVPTLNEKLYRMTFTREAGRLGIDKSAEYKNDVADYKNSMVFSAFIQKVVAPDVKMTEDEIKAYYQEHISEYTTPAMAKVQGLVFTKKNYAEDALDKLQKGTDPQWVRNNAAGQVEQKTAEDLLEFTNKLLMVNSFPEGLRKVIADAKPGDIRLYQSPDNYFYTVLIQDTFPAKASPLETERKEITKKIFGLKMNKALEDWSDQLKKEYKVRTFLTDLGK